MGKVKLIIHECFAGKQNPEEVFTAVFLSKAAALTENAKMMLRNLPQGALCPHWKNLSSILINFQPWMD